MNSNLKKYKNIHKGKRVFLIGNGPSLSKTDLDLIKDEYSIAMNKISLIFDKTKWRPTYFTYFAVAHKNNEDKNKNKEYTDCVLKSIKETKIKSFVWEKFKKDFDKKKNNIEWVKNVTETKPNANGDLNKKWWPKNIEKNMDKSATTMNLALQLANYMGFSEIIFLGVDLGMTSNTSKDKDSNHFSNSYNSQISEEKVKKINNQLVNLHYLARMKIPKEIKIYNASLTTKLDVYPKICYETLMKNNKIKYIN